MKPMFHKKTLCACLALVYSTAFAANVSPDASGKTDCAAGSGTTCDYVPNGTNVKTVTVANGNTLNMGAAAIVIQQPANGFASGTNILNANGNGILAIDGNLDIAIANGDIGSNNKIVTSINGTGGGKIYLHGNNTIRYGEASGKTNKYKSNRAIWLSDVGTKLVADGGSTTITIIGDKENTYGLRVWNGAEAVFSNATKNHLFKMELASNQSMVDARNGGKITFDLLQLDGTGGGTLGTSNGRMILVIGDHTENDANQSSLSFLGGDFNQTTSNAYGATALDANQFGKITVLGHDGGHLNIKTGGSSETGINSIGGSQVIINKDGYANFKTRIDIVSGASTVNHNHGIRVGSLPTVVTSNADRYNGSEYGNSLVTIYGTTEINTDNNRAYGLKIVGDGSKLYLFALNGQDRSSISSQGTAIKYGSANGYSYDRDGSTLLSAGGQTVHLEKTDVTNRGATVSGDSDGVYTGNLIQVGSHGQEITTDGHQHANTVGTQSAYRDLVKVADVVKNATLNLIDSTATAYEDAADDSKSRDLINITYGGGTTGVPDTFASNITVNAVHDSLLNGAIFTDYTLDTSSTVSKLNLNLTDNSTWNITRDSGNTQAIWKDVSVYDSASQNWQDIAQGSAVKGNFLSDLTVNSGSAVKFAHSGGSNTFKNLYVAGNYSGNGGEIHLNTYLGDETSPTDQMHVKGNTSGSTKIFVNSVENGPGAKTANFKGIPLVLVDGNSPTGSFTLGNPVQAGAYEYVLRQGSEFGASYANRTALGANDWYLISDISAPPLSAALPEPVPIYRSGVANYVAARQANSRMGLWDLSTLHHRVGEHRTLPTSEKQSWARTWYHESKERGKKRFGYEQRSNGLQLGQEFLARATDNNGFERAAVAVNYMLAKADFNDRYRSFLPELNRNTGSLEAQSISLGGYYTRVDEKGAYVDMVGNIANLRNKFHNAYSDGVYDSAVQKGWRIGLSAEGGYPLHKWGEEKNWLLEAQSQLSYQWTNYDSFEDQFSKIDAYDMNSLVGRLGLRLVKTSKLEDDRTRQTYGLLNVHHEFLDSKGMSANNWYCPGTTQKCSVSENFGNAWAEAGIGSQGWISKSTSVFGDMRYQWGLSHKLEGYSVNLGIRHMF